MKKRYMPTFLVSLLCAAAAAGCGHSRQSGNEGSTTESDSLPDNIVAVIKAVSDGNGKKFADLVTYPLQRPYPLHDITSKEQMVAYYPILVDDSLRNVIAGSKPADWSSVGWRGWMLDNGQYLWIDEGVYAVNYVSRREQQLLDSLTRKDMASISPQLRQGWLPEGCYMDTTSRTIYRIDRAVDNQNDDTEYRLAVYSSLTPTNGMPDKVILGEERYEGSGAFHFYDFIDGDDDYSLFADASSDEDGLSIRIKQKDKDPVSVTLIPVYWLDVVRK